MMLKPTSFRQPGRSIDDLGVAGTATLILSP